MRKYVVIPDSFKGCLTSARVAQAVDEGLRQINPSSEISLIPMSDGGEGMLSAVAPLLNARYVTCNTYDPLMRRIEARYAVTDDGRAVIESALVCGMSLLTQEELNPRVATTYGLGILIADALNRGCSSVTVGLGGSATCDAGVGMIKALNDKFSGDGHFDAKVRAMMKGKEFTVLADVTNPLLGDDGAAHVFAPQKGASAADVDFLEWRIAKFASMSAAHFGYDRSKDKSAGAAGGLGYAFMQYLGADVKSGADYIMDLTDFDGKSAGADAIITGEGCADAQTLMGKLPYKVLQRSRGIPVHLLAGKVKDAAMLREAGFATVTAVTPGDQTPEQYLDPDTAYKNIVSSVAAAVL